MPDDESTNDREALLEHRLLRTLAHNAPYRIYAKDADGRFIFANQVVADGMGVESPAALIGHTDFDFYPHADASRYHEQEQQVLSSGVPMIGREEHVKYLLVEREAWLVTTKIPLHDETGKAIGLVGINCDITPQKLAERALNAEITRRRRLEEKLRHQVEVDPLTGLPNRTRLLGRIRAAIDRARVEGHELAVLLIDLDHFKDVNDTLGHSVGNNLLETVTRRIGRCIRTNETLARVGADQFVVLLEGGRTRPGMESLAMRIHGTICAPVTLAGRELAVTCCIGCSVFPDDGGDAEALLERAGTAMYAAKEQGRNRVRRYAQTLRRDASPRSQTEARLRRALERDEFVLHFQPQLRARDGAIVGVEALVRWRHPERGLVDPLEFIPIAEQSGLIGAIGSWVLHAACRQAMAWLRVGLPPMRIGVNLSPMQLQDPTLDGQLQRVLCDTGLPVHMLELELTESASMKDPEETIRVLGQLNTHGIGLAIDDFGIGYSNLAYLMRFPVQRLKLDQSFVAAMGDDAASRTIVETMVDLAHKLHLEVVAEGVETAAQRDQLVAFGCDVMQGFLFSKPIDAPSCEALLRAAARDNTRPRSVAPS